MKSIKNSEKGQIVVLLVLVVIGLLGMTALAIDGSMIFSDRRFTQSVADSASLAGGNAIKDIFIDQSVDDINFACGSSDVINAVVDGFNAALPRIDEYYDLPTTAISSGDLDFDNGLYTIPGVDLAGHQVWVSCNAASDALTVYVQLTSQTDTAFMHLVSDQIARNSVEAETKIISQQTLTGGHTIISLRQDCSDGAGGTLIQGGVTMTLFEGGTCSNSCLNLPNAALDLYSDGPLFYDGTIENGLNEHQNIDDTYYSTAPIYEDCTNPEPFQDMFDKLAARCGTMEKGIRVSTGTGSNKSYTFFQGKYDNSNFNKITNNDSFFHPGLYCFYVDVDISGGLITANDVTFVFLDSNPTIQIAGNPHSILTADVDHVNNTTGFPPVDGIADTPAPTGRCESDATPHTYKKINNDGTCDSGYHLELTESKAEPAILFYVTSTLIDKNKNTLKLTGDSDTWFDGIIYAPNTYITITGNANASSVEFGVSVIGYDVTLQGNSDTTFTNYDEGVPNVSGWLDMLK